MTERLRSKMSFKSNDWEEKKSDQEEVLLILQNLVKNKGKYRFLTSEGKKETTDDSKRLKLNEIRKTVQLT